MPNIAPPLAFFDTLDEMANPFKQPVKSLQHLAVDASAEAISDYQSAAEFIYSYRGSPDTFSTYRREIEHFLHWCLVIAKKSLKQVVRED
ncbi:MAG: site-specific integrase, partial [Gammaproteobacteria bacterium]|nr:site-specific integrase [Gammaproteobacteria bacterium]